MSASKQASRLKIRLLAQRLPLLLALSVSACTAAGTAVASELGGKTIRIDAGNNLTVRGSQVIGDSAVTLTAKNDIAIEAARNSSAQSSFTQTRTDGLFSSGGLSVTYGLQQQSSDGKTQGTSAQASTVGAVGGNVSITAGNTYRQSGSDLSTPAGDISVLAQRIDITEARETTAAQTETLFKQSGLTLALTSPVLSAVQSVAAQAQAAGQTSSSRMGALAAANSAMALNNAGTTLAQGQASPDASAAAQAGGINLSISIGASQSQSNSHNQSDSARGSTLSAGGNISLIAQGGGQNSDITLQGATVKAGGTAALSAEDQINLLAASNNTSQHSSNKTSSGSIGVSVGTSGMGVTASASAAKGHGNGSETTYSNTHLSGNTVTLTSGGDTTLQGAVVSGASVQADIGGKLKIESLQDSASYHEKQTSVGASVTIGAGASGSVSASRTKIDSEYKSVVEQSGIRAGDGGFQVNVKGSTELIGGAITSSDKAVAEGKNSFTTTTLTTSDLQNQAAYSAKSLSVSAGTGAGSTSAGLGNQSDSAASTTRSGISGIAGDKSARTGDAESGITRIFDAQAVKADVQAQVAITQEFGKQAPKAVADFAVSQIKGLDAQIKEAAASGDKTRVTELNTEKAKWAEGGDYRVAMHATIGALGGGVSGALGAAASAEAAPTIDTLQAQLTTQVATGLRAAGLDDKTAQAIGEGAGKLIVNATGAALTLGSGSNAAAMALNVDANNRQLHPSERTWAKDNAAKYRQYLADKIGEQISTEEAYQRLLSAGYAVVDDTAGKTGKSDETAKRFIGEAAPAALFAANAAERANPFQNGNVNGSYSPEQQARFGVAEPGTNAQGAITKAMQYVGQPCTDCRTKFAAIDSAVSALQEARLLYQDDPGSVRLIDQQIDQLKAGISKDELARGMAGAIGDKDKGLAALVLGNPSRLVAGAATAETLERVTLTQAIKDARAALPTSGLRNGGNVAAAQIDIPGLPSTMGASSRVDEAAKGLVGDGSQNFTHMTLPNTEGKLIPRNTDSEYKILDNIADLLGSDTSARGSVKIVTERPACDSCLDVVKQFRARYPGVDVKIFDNNGVLLPPPKKPTGGP